jgi:hypothetical protein
MGPLPPAIIQCMSCFAPLFSSRVWPHAQVLLTGAILVPGKRTVSALLRVMGLDHRSDFQTYHRVLNRCVWSTLQGSQILLQVLLATFTPRGRLVFGLDDTIERRRGDHIAAKGLYRDPVRSSQGHFVKASGLRWLSLMLLVPVSWAARIWALPFLTVLCPSERYYQARGRSHQPLLKRAQQMLCLLARWVPTRSVVVVADQAFSALAFLDAVRHQVAVITRLRLDAALFEPAPPSTGRYGRPTALQRRPVTDPPSAIRGSQDPLAKANDKRMVCHRKTHPPYRFGHGRVVSLRFATGAHPLAVGQTAQRVVPTPSIAQHRPSNHTAADADLFHPALDGRNDL